MSALYRHVGLPMLVLLGSLTFSVASAPIVFDLGREEFNEPLAVSYTHLDVYKRQLKYFDIGALET